MYIIIYLFYFGKSFILMNAYMIDTPDNNDKDALEKCTFNCPICRLHVVQLCSSLL